MPVYLGKIGAKDYQFISTKKGLGSHRNWRRQYAGYSQAILQSDIGGMEDFAKKLTAGEKAGFLKLYRSGNEFPTFVRKELLRARKVRCCPYCGMQSNVTVDHYLPKELFPQFSCFSLNLVPACSDCQNKGNKGIKHPKRKRRLTPSPDRFVHPYLDKFLRDCVIGIHFKAGEHISDIQVFPKKGSATARRILQYHIDTLKLSYRAPRDIDRVWEGLIRTVVGNPGYAERATLIEMLRKKREEEWLVAGSLNAIAVAFTNSLVSSEDGLTFLMRKAQEPRAPFLNRRIAAGRW